MARRVFIIEDEAVAREVEAMLERKRINIERRRVNSYRRQFYHNNPHVSCGGSRLYETQSCGGSCGNTLGSCGGSRLYETPSCSVGPSCGSFEYRRRNIMSSCSVGPSC